MGHAIDETAHISDGVANAFVKDTSTEAFSIVRSWCAEAAADLIAARVMGPAPMFALLSLEYCVYPMYSVHQPSKTHPATMWRFDSVTEYLKQLNGGLDLLSVERNRYHIAYEHSLMRAGHDKHARVRESNQRSYEFVFKPLVSAICDKIGKLNLEASKFDQESLDRCALRLKRGFPIAAQGVARKDLRSKIERYREQRPDLSGEQSGEPKRQRFAELAEEFAEKPLSIPTIIASGYLRRLELISAISERETLPEYSELERMCDDLRGLDELVLHSIRTSAIHKHIVDARTRGEA
jgi:hypothetical protein